MTESCHHGWTKRCGPGNISRSGTERIHQRPAYQVAVFKYSCTCLIRRTLGISSSAFGALVESLQVHLGRVSRTILQSNSSAPLCMDSKMAQSQSALREGHGQVAIRLIQPPSSTCDGETKPACHTRENWRCILSRTGTIEKSSRATSFLLKVSAMAFVPLSSSERLTKRRSQLTRRGSKAFMNWSVGCCSARSVL